MSITDSQRLHQDPVDRLNAAIESVCSVKVTEYPINLADSVQRTNQMIRITARDVLGGQVLGVLSPVLKTVETATDLAMNIGREASERDRHRIMADLYEWVARVVKCASLIHEVVAHTEKERARAKAAKNGNGTNGAH